VSSLYENFTYSRHLLVHMDLHTGQTWPYHLPSRKENITFLGEENNVHAFLKYED